MSHGEHSENPHWRTDHDKKWVKIGDDRTVCVSAKATNITWGNDSRFWNWVDLPQSELCFKVGVELVQVCWLEVTGMLDLAMLNVSQPTRYEIIYLIKLKADAFGWGQVPISFEVSVPNADRQKKSVSLEQYKEQYDKWLEVSGGCVEIKPGMSGHLEFRMLEVETRWWKGGMVFEGVKIQPYSHK